MRSDLSDALYANEEQTLTPSKAKSVAPTPQSSDEEREYWSIYKRHIAAGETVLDIARSMGISRSTVDRIVAWCRQTLGTPTGGPAVEDLVMSLLDNHKRYAKLIADEEARPDSNIKVILSIMREDRMNSLALARVKAWTQSNIQIGDKVVNIGLPDCAIKPGTTIDVTPEATND